MPKIVVGLFLTAFLQVSVTPAADLHQTIRRAQSKVVKIYGAGGLRQFEAYQSGILVSPAGHILTARSYVLDTDDLAVLLDDGRQWQAELIGSDPVKELALLKLPEAAEPLPYFNLKNEEKTRFANPGQRIMALSNLYGIATGDEPVSVLQGVITAVAPLRARRGAFQSSYRDQVYVLDAYANNPGAAGGALIDWRGRLLGILGKELRSEVTGTWLNYALPTQSFATTVEDLIAGRVKQIDVTLAPPEQAYSTEKLGLALIPDVLPRTPPYVDRIGRNSLAERAGLLVDDLIVFVGGQPVNSHREVDQQLARFDTIEPLTISVLRGAVLKEFSFDVNDQATGLPSQEGAKP